jgi:hypothetical protein
MLISDGNKRWCIAWHVDLSWLQAGLVMEEEHRRQVRRRTLKAGKIIFNHHLSVIDCTIRNLSDGGALLEIPNTIGVPDNFELWIDAEKKSRPCRVAWKTATRVGVAFQ